MHKRKLIEVALPLEAINTESAHEKSVPRKGHPATLHLWWARRPVAAARALLFAQLVDDPVDRPDEFPTQEEQRAERERLHHLIQRLAKWENTTDEKLMAEACSEIMRSTGGRPPAILDPFAGGGTIPLEAQRLGLAAQASDLNPVSVLVNKALLEIPRRFHDQRPVYPGLADSQIRSWTGTQGLAADVRAYGEWIRKQASDRIGAHYPKVRLSDGSQATVIAWLWARTVVCPNPACGMDAPLVRTWWLGKKRGREAYIVPSVVYDRTRTSGRRIEFSIGRGKSSAPTPANDGTVSRGVGRCLACDAVIPNDHIRAQATSDGLGAQLMAVIAEGSRQRIFLAPEEAQVAAARVERPTDVPNQLVPTPNHDVDRLPMYGMPRWSDAFTDRQLLTLVTLSDLVLEAREDALHDALEAGLPLGDRLADGGSGADAYADAIATYLAFLGSKLADWSSSLCSWIPQIEGVRDTFARQAIAMAWDYVEINPFSNSVGNISGHFEWIVSALGSLPQSAGSGSATQADAATRTYDGYLVATDPPYYDNIGYSDLSDYFYVWLRRSLRSIHPSIFETMLVPKAEELVANPNRHGGRNGAEEFFEKGFESVFSHARQAVLPEFPMTVYYAFKQSESDGGEEASKGWETLLEGMIRAGWEITSTWPLRSERGGRMLSVGTNALASSIVLSLRPRPNGAPTIDRRGFIQALHSELPDALRKLQQGGIAPVDLPQAAIGPGMAVFSRYGAVLENDGSKMSVRSALARINEILDQVLNEQEGDFDPTTRFAIQWYRQHGYNVGLYGDADNLARARNTSVDVLDRDGVLSSRAGNVQLIRPADLEWNYDPVRDAHTSNWEALHHLVKTLERDGIAPAGNFLAAALSRPDRAVDADLVKELGHLLFRIAEANGWTKDALSFNGVVTSWPDIMDVARESGSRRQSAPAQSAFSFDEDE